jgi:hypothetical protein
MKTTTQNTPKSAKPKPSPPVETEEERKKYGDWLYGQVAQGFASRLEVIDEESGGDQFANREDSRFEDSARRVHLFTWHLMRQRDVADFNEKMFAYNSDSDESQDDDI